MIALLISVDKIGLPIGAFDIIIKSPDDYTRFLGAPPTDFDCDSVKIKNTRYAIVYKERNKRQPHGLVSAFADNSEEIYFTSNIIVQKASNESLTPQELNDIKKNVVWTNSKAGPHPVLMFDYARYEKGGIS